ncbi:short-chain dehydrogenase [Rhexocercosporidium sp. MPI-PUGE-AT-0058]|nr:short-chain dehydrogenase [Rhexocercosporidium sp. MPI-PUGE-AT-0058]
MTSHPEFGETTTATEVAKIFAKQINGKSILVVGVSPLSLGEHIALSISQHTPKHLLLASRTPSKISSVIDKIHTLSPSIHVTPIQIDLSSQFSIRAAAKEILSQAPKIDILINNAAVNVPGYEETKEGIEMHFGTNYIGLFLLTNILLPAIISSASTSAVPGQSRIVNLTSAGHRLSPVRFSDWNFKRSIEDVPVDERPPEGLPPKLMPVSGETYNAFLAYGQSKTANVLFSGSLNRVLGEKGVRSYAVHPGSIWTGLARNLDEEGQELIKKTGKFWKSGDQGAAGALVAAFDPALNNIPEKGYYMADCQVAEAAPSAIDEGMAKRLWVLSEELVGEKFDLKSL